MKSLKELEAIRQRTLDEVNLRQDHTGARVVVGMATCGIAAGARPVLMEFVRQVNEKDLKDITVTQTGCIGVCRLEPMVEVYMPGEEKVTYVKMTAEKVSRVINDHIVNGRPVEEYTIGYYEANNL